MKKSNLRDGMRVKLRNGETGTVYDHRQKILSDSIGAYFLMYYNEDLTRNDNSPDADIVEVSNTIWTRKDDLKEDIKEVTMKDIGEKFGCKVKIVG